MNQTSVQQQPYLMQRGSITMAVTSEANTTETKTHLKVFEVSCSSGTSQQRKHAVAPIANSPTRIPMAPEMYIAMLHTRPVLYADIREIKSC